jgi:hypothetical protein
LPLNGAAIWNGQLLKQHFVCSFDGTEYPAVEEFPDRFDGDGDRDAERVAECMNWCRKNCKGNWLLTTREHVRQLWEVFVSFDDAADQAAYLRECAGVPDARHISGRGPASTENVDAA